LFKHSGASAAFPSGIAMPMRSFSPRWARGALVVGGRHTANGRVYVHGKMGRQRHDGRRSASVLQAGGPRPSARLFSSRISGAYDEFQIRIIRVSEAGRQCGWRSPAGCVSQRRDQRVTDSAASGGKKTMPPTRGHYVKGDGDLRDRQGLPEWGRWPWAGQKFKFSPAGRVLATRHGSIFLPVGQALSRCSHTFSYRR